MSGVELAVIGAGIGAIANKDDPIKGAILGGAAGFTGGSLLGAGAATGAAGGVAGGTGLTAGAASSSGAMRLGGGLSGVASAAPTAAAPLAASSAAPLATSSGIGLGSGIMPMGSMAAPQAASGMTPMQGLQAAIMINQLSGGTRTNVSPPQIRQGRAPTLADPIQGLLAANMPRRRQPMSLLG